jgi:glycosyltransferase involved in cell wall biosynthesis
LAQQVSTELASTGIIDRFLLLQDCLNAETLMSQFDVFALPSRYEGATYAVMEAMRAGTPVIVTDVVGNRDAVEDGHSGLFVPADDPEALADAMCRLLSDPALSRRIGEAGRARVAERFDVRKSGQALAHLYRSLAKQRS